jgi:glutamate-1-semialdehyde aminotransferase/spore coat polysaccharide biosynthesis protein SpsF (cytidylyltransferase family)
MGSTRFPGKIMAHLAGRPVLAHVIDRVGMASAVDGIIVATSSNRADDPVDRYCQERGIQCYRGSEEDVLDRFHGAAAAANADAILRITADCPLVDPEVVDLVVSTFKKGAFDYVANTLVPTFPDGLDTEVFSKRALDRAHEGAKLKSEREHVTPYMWKHPELFRLHNVRNEPDYSTLRWTVDEPGDLEYLQLLFDSAPDTSRMFMRDVLSTLARHPELASASGRPTRNEGYATSLRADLPIMDKETPFTTGTGQRLYKRAKELIPGGTQLLSKRPEMFLPDNWPSYFSKAKGVDVWDLDGNRYVDMCYNGIGACILGAADADVDSAVKNAIDSGSMSTLNAREEVELAELLCELHPWAEMVRYARSGGEAMVIAIRIARASTRRDKIAFCGYHGWHDWYLAANLSAEGALDGHLLPGLLPSGVPRGLLGTAVPFRYNHIEELRQIAASLGKELAAIVMEPIRDNAPHPGFLEEVREISREIGAVFIFDEITAAFRQNTGGAHLLLGVNPDIAVLAKAMSNGYPMAAIIGREAIMQAAQNTFISSTYWTERLGPVAALATIRKHRACNVGTHLTRIGNMVQTGWRDAAAAAALGVNVSGIAPLGHLSFANDEGGSIRTLFTQMMLERGFLATGAFYATYAHQDHHVDAYLDATAEVFSRIAAAIRANTVGEQLRGPAAHSGFARLA